MPFSPIFQMIHKLNKAGGAAKKNAKKESPKTNEKTQECEVKEEKGKSDSRRKEQSMTLVNA